MEMKMNNALLGIGRYLAFYPCSLIWTSVKRLAVKALPVKLASGSMSFGIMSKTPDVEPRRSTFHRLSARDQQAVS
jgi:hypothetical protein